MKYHESVRNDNRNSEKMWNWILPDVGGLGVGMTATK